MKKIRGSERNSGTKAAEVVGYGAEDGLRFDCQKCAVSKKG